MNRTCESEFYENEELVLQSAGYGSAKLNKSVGAAPAAPFVVPKERR